METKLAIIVPHIRWMIRRDMQEVLAIENDSFPNPWSEEEFVDTLRSRNTIGMVAEIREKIVGFMIYDLHKSRLDLVNLAVAWGDRNRAVGTALIQKLKDKLAPQRRVKIRADIRERNLDAQLFFKKLGFKATKLIKEMYDDFDEDCIRFEYAITKSDDTD